MEGFIEYPGFDSFPKSNAHQAPFVSPEKARAECIALGYSGFVVGRAESDAPEVDLVAFVHAPEARVGDRIMARIDEVDEEFNWVGAQVEGAE